MCLLLGLEHALTFNAGKAKPNKSGRQSTLFGLPPPEPVEKKTKTKKRKSAGGDDEDAAPAKKAEGGDMAAYLARSKTSTAVADSPAVTASGPAAPVSVLDRPVESIFEDEETQLVEVCYMQNFSTIRADAPIYDSRRVLSRRLNGREQRNLPLNRKRSRPFWLRCRQRLKLQRNKAASGS